MSPLNCYRTLKLFTRREMIYYLIEMTAFHLVLLGNCCSLHSQWRTEDSVHSLIVFEHLNTVDLLITSQEQQYGLHGAEAVDWHALVYSVLLSGGHRRQLHHQIHDTLHRGGLLQPHFLHLHLRRHQEDGWDVQLLSHQYRLPA